MEVHVNYLAVIVAMLSSLAVGSAWYAQATFGKIWARLANIDTTKHKDGLLTSIAITVVVSLVTAYILAHVAYLSNQFFHHSFLQDAVMTAFWLWLGLVAARIITRDAFEGRPTTLTLLNIGSEFVTIMIMGLIIGLFGV